MRSFDEIFAIAAARHGGADALRARLPKPKAPAQIRATPDDRFLSAMTKCVFQAGFSWTVIEKKWPGFEAAFEGFDLGRCAMLHDEAIEALTADDRIVRNGQKIRSVQTNAAFLIGLGKEHGSAAAFFARTDQADYVALLDLLKKKGSRLGGNSGQRFLRMMGVPSFILSPDTLARLEAEGVIDGPATSTKALRRIQAAFDSWRAESGLSLTEIGATLALSIDGG